MRARRLAALLRKEALQVVRDPSSIAIAFAMPLLLLALFGYAVSLDARNVRLGLVVEASGGPARDLISRFAQSEYFHPVLYRHFAAAEADFLAHRLDGILWLGADFEQRLAAGETAAALYLNGVDANQARLVAGYVEGAWEHWRAAAGRAGAVLVPRIWFNPAAESRHFLVPGLVAIVMTLTGSLLTAMVVAREWERGTFEALLATPLERGALIAGKLLPYFALGMASMAVVVAAAVAAFGVPLRGSLGVLGGVAALYLLACLALGLAISAATRSQFLAAQVALFATFLPAFMLSGFLFEVAAMPAPVRLVAELVPARHFVALLQSGFLAGDVPALLARHGLALAGEALFFLALALRAMPRRLA
ncbi:MAG: membrane protein [Porticoccaceae bacterium]|nr:MAG: membrane protein [Porticoccaceae bacterium]